MKKSPYFKEIFALIMRGDNRNRTGDIGVADLCLTAWPCRLTAAQILYGFNVAYDIIFSRIWQGEIFTTKKLIIC